MASSAAPPSCRCLTVLAALVPGSKRQSLHHFLHDAPWDVEALNRQRMALWQAHPTLAPHAAGVLIIDETGDRKRGHGIELAANQYLGKLGHTANGVVSVTSQWTDGTRSMPLGVRPYWPARRLPLGKKDPRFRTKPELAWEMIEEARALIPFRLVVADCIYGENPTLEGRLWQAKIPYVMAIRPSHGTWQLVEDETDPPAFTPPDAALRHPLGPGSARCDTTAMARNWSATWRNWPCRPPMVPTSRSASSPPARTPRILRPSRLGT